MHFHILDCLIIVVGFNSICHICLKLDTANCSRYKLGTKVAFKNQACIERPLGLKTSSSFHMGWTLISLVFSLPFLDRFARFLNLCWLGAPSLTPAQRLDWPPKLNWPVREERLDGLFSDRVHCILHPVQNCRPVLTAGWPFLTLMGCSLAYVIVFWLLFDF